MKPTQERPPRKTRELLKKGKKGLLQFIFSRIGIVMLLLILQVGALLLLFFKFRHFFPHYYTFSAILAVGMAIYILNTDTDPDFKLTWLTVILLLPAAGTLLYLYIHSDIGHRALRARTNTITKESANELPQTSAFQKLKQQHPEDASLAQYLQNTSNMPVYDQCAASYLPVGEDFLAQLLEDLESAKSFIFLEYFIIEDGKMWDQVEGVLARKAAEGVDVRVLYDGTCEFSRLPHRFPSYLNSLGIQCRIFAPIHPFVSTHYNYRDHRKIAVIDGNISYTGGLNLADEYANFIQPFGHWKDTAVRLEGEASRSFTLLFLQMWQVEDRELTFAPYLSAPYTAHPEASGFVIPYGDCPLDDNYVGEMVYTHILNTAQSYVHIMTPYLILGHELESALEFAAQRGVEVSIIMPSVPDHTMAYALAKTHYKALIKCGVKLYEYTPGFVHAKSFVSDDVRASVGTINLDYRSLRHHFECATYLCGTDCIKDIEEDFQQTLAQCKPITMEEATHIGFKWRLMGTLLKLFAPLI